MHLDEKITLANQASAVTSRRHYDTIDTGIQYNTNTSILECMALLALGLHQVYVCLKNDLDNDGIALTRYKAG